MFNSLRCLTTSPRLTPAAEFKVELVENKCMLEICVNRFASRGPQVFEMMRHLNKLYITIRYSRFRCAQRISY